MTQWIGAQFAVQGAPIDKVCYFPFHSQHGDGNYRMESYDRKPNPEMLLKAQPELDRKQEQSVFIRDKCTDIIAARAAKVG